MKINKILNNNVVITLNNNGEEIIDYAQSR